MSQQEIASIAYNLLCAALGLGLLGMAANEWRRLHSDDYRRLMIAAALIALARGAHVAWLLTGLAPGGVCLEWTLQGWTLTLLVWASLFDLTAKKGAVIFLTVTIVGLGASTALCLLTPITPWPVMSLLLCGVGLALWLRRRRRASLLLGGVLLLSLAGAGAGVAGSLPGAALFPLLALTLWLVETYRAIVTDLSAYSQELRQVSDQALRQTQNLAFLLEVSQTIASSLDLSVVLERVSEALARTVDADWAYVLLHDESDPDQLTVAARYGWWGRHWTQDSQIRRKVVVRLADFSLLSHAVQRRRQVVANEPEDYEQFDRLHDILARPQSGPTLVQPIHLQDKSLGVLLMGHVGSHRTFSEADAKICKALMGQVATAIDNARLYHSVDEQARRLAELLRIREEEATQRQAILESITDGVVVAGQGGEVVLVNAAAERILGLPHEKLMGQTIRRLYAQLLRQGEYKTGERVVFEWGDKMVMGSLAPVRMPDGAVLGYVGVFRDVTREQQAERAKSQFVATVSHELRTPMTSIKGYVELMAAGAVGDLNPRQKQFLEIVGHNAERMIALVNNLITVSEMERGPIRIEPQRVNMAQVIRDAVQSIRARADERQIDLVVNLPDDLSPAWGAPRSLRQIMDNLLDNALRYTYPQGRITVWAAEAHVGEGDEAQDYLVVSIRDTGVGIPAEEQERIFEKFYRAENPLSVEAGGAGVGLAIVKSLVTAHGGRVWVESEPQKGSTFSFTVPTG